MLSDLKLCNKCSSPVIVIKKAIGFSLYNPPSDLPSSGKLHIDTCVNSGIRSGNRLSPDSRDYVIKPWPTHE